MPSIALLSAESAPAVPATLCGVSRETRGQDVVMVALPAPARARDASALARNLLADSVFPESGKDDCRSLTSFRYRAEV